MEEQVCLEEALDYSKNIMLNANKDMAFSEYCRGFFNTNECIKGYLNSISYQKGKALTVLSSGDHVFNLIHDGVTEIDAFDINRLQYYVYHLRRAFIMAFSYHEFLDLECFFHQSFDLEGKLIVLEKVRRYLPVDVYLYFSDLIRYVLAHPDANYSNLYYFSLASKRTNNYLANESEYKKLQERLEKAKVSLYFENATNIPKIVSGNYDIVLLSNIIDYIWQYYDCPLKEALKTFMQSYLDILNNDGCVVNYSFKFADQLIPLYCDLPICDNSKEEIHQISDSIYDYHGYYLARRLK